MVVNHCRGSWELKSGPVLSRVRAMTEPYVACPAPGFPDVEKLRALSADTPAFLGPVDAFLPSQQHFSVCHCHPNFGVFAFKRWILSQPLTCCCIQGKHLITLFHFFLNLGSVSNRGLGPIGPSVSELI